MISFLTKFVNCSISLIAYVFQLFSSSEFNHLPLAAKDFVKHLLVINPDKRYSVKEAKDHHWFKEHIMWDEIEAQTV